MNLVTKAQILSDGMRITGSRKTSLLELDIATGEEVNAFMAESGCTAPEGIKGSERTVVLEQAGKHAKQTSSSSEGYHSTVMWPKRHVGRKGAID